MFGVSEFPSDVLWCGLSLTGLGSMGPLFPDSHVFQVLFVCFNFPNAFPLSYSGTLTNFASYLTLLIFLSFP